MTRTPFRRGTPAYKAGPDTCQSASDSDHAREIKSENALEFSSLLWRSCGERGVSVKERGKKRVRKVEPKVLVEKKAFDKVLGKLIQTKPIKRRTAKN